MPKLTASDSATMGVRLTHKQRKELDRLAEQNNVEVSQLIRWAIDALIAHVERNGGRLLLPVDFSETFEVKTVQRQEKAQKVA